jgi:signal peptidase I
MSTGPTAPAPAADQHEERKGRKGGPVRSALEWVGVLAGAVVIAFLIKTFLVQAFYIPSASMEDTLKISDRVLVNKLSYRLHGINRGDIVVFERPPESAGEGARDLIKRVIALEGETIEGRDGRVWINGRPLNEPYLPPDAPVVNFAPQKIPDAHVWVMGDNRPNSKDSRVFGPIADSAIVGRAFIRVWPVSSLRFL